MPIGSIISGVANMHNALVNTGLGIANTAMQFGQNIQNQKNWEESFEYQKNLNNILMEREDNSVQRRAADLAKAGINPMLAGLEGASATPGGIINPLAQSAPQIPEGTGTINGDAVAGAVEELAKRKAAEQAQNTEIKAQLELQRRQINASNLADDKKYKADRQLEELESLHRIIEARLNAKDTAEQNKLDRDLQWKIATHKALRELFTNSEVPFLDNIWKELIDNAPDDLIVDGKLNFNTLNKLWERAWRKEDKKEDEKARTRTDSEGIKRHKLW